MTAPTQLAVALGIILKEKKMLIRESPKGHIELPGFTVRKSKEAIQQLQEFIEKLKLKKEPQQTLYLTEVRMSDSTKKKIPAIVRLVHLNKIVNFNLPDTWFESLDKILIEEKATPLSRAVAKWILTK